jgi:eukaryotic-like serine/threonine-protein kinase
MLEKDPLNISGQVVAEKYRIEHLVGEGGFAVVYLAEHTIWKQPVAVKFFSGVSQAPPEQRDELLHQFIQEGALLTELSSQTAGIVQARDVGEYTTHTGQWMPFMVLEWLDGSPLDTILEEDHRLGHPWTESEVLGFLRRILPILDVAHRRGIAHRDIKPANIFIMGSNTRAPDTPCKLLDFGVAKMVSDQASVNAALAKTGMAITSFTPRYGAPEQFTRSYGATGPWTDVFSVALVACEMLAGRVALQGDDVVQVGFASANPAQRPTPRSLGVAISDRLEAAFAKALAVRPEDRFQCAEEFLAATTLGTADSAQPSPPQKAASPSMQFAPTLLLRLDSSSGAPAPATPASPATKSNPPPEGRQKERQKDARSEKHRKSGIASFLFILVVLAAGLVAFSTTELRGAREVRGFLSSLIRVARKEADEHLPNLREKTRKAVDNAVGMLSGAGGHPGQEPECPPGSRRMRGLPAHGQPPVAGSGQHRQTGPVCVDEHLVSEIDYFLCVSCERPRLGGSRVRKAARGQSEFCVDGREPTTNPIRCATWRHADSYCRSRASRLPTEDELHAVTSTATEASREWTESTPAAASDKWRPFRCVRSP